MTDADYYNALSRFKDQSLFDTPERAVLVIGNDPLARVCIAWGNVPRVVRPYNVPAGVKRSWVALWVAVDFDEDLFREMAGFKEHERNEFKRLWGIAMANRLVFPDGTLSHWVQLRLQALAVV